MFLWGAQLCYLRQAARPAPKRRCPGDFGKAGLGEGSVQAQGAHPAPPRLQPSALSCTCTASRGAADATGSRGQAHGDSHGQRAVPAPRPPFPSCPQGHVHGPGGRGSLLSTPLGDADINVALFPGKPAAVWWPERGEWPPLAPTFARAPTIYGGNLTSTSVFGHLFKNANKDADSMGIVLRS